MAATNTERTGGRTFYKLKEDERSDSKSKGELRFFEQVKIGEKWGDGEAYNQLDGTFVKVDTKEYEFQGDKKRALIIGLQDGDNTLEFTLGFRSFTAQGILNTLAGNNPLKLYFVCGKPKESNGKFYATLYINKDGASNEEKRTTWKYTPSELPKVTTTKDDDGNVIKKGVKAADDFWLKVVSEIQSKLGSPAQAGTGAQGLKNNANFGNEKSAQKMESVPQSTGDNSDLPF